MSYIGQKNCRGDSVNRLKARKQMTEDRCVSLRARRAGGQGSERTGFPLKACWNDTHKVALPNIIISIFSLLFITLGCSYTPECNRPADNELSNPSDLIEYNGNILIVNADSSAKFCSGYVSEMNVDTGEVIKRYDIGDRDTAFLGRGALWKSSNADILLLTERGNDSLIAYNLDEDNIFWRIRVGDDPLGIAVDETRNHTLVTNLRDDSVSVIQLGSEDTTSEVSRIFLPGGLNGYRPTSIVLSQDKNTAYVSGRLYPIIYKIDMDLLTLVTDYINLETTVSGLDNRDLYTTDSNLYVVMRSPPAIGVINLLSNDIRDFIPLKSGPYGIGILSQKGLLFVSEYRDNLLLKIDINTGKILSEISVGDGPSKILITSDGRYLFTANYRGNTVTRIELGTWEVKEFPEQ